MFSPTSRPVLRVSANLAGRDGGEGAANQRRKQSMGFEGAKPLAVLSPISWRQEMGGRRGLSDLRPACGGSQTELQFCGSCEPENQSSAAKCGKEATKRKSKFSRQVKTGRCVRQSGRAAKCAPPAAVRGGPLMLGSSHFACGAVRFELQFCGSCEPENQSSTTGC